MEEQFKKVHTKKDEPALGEKHVPIVDITEDDGKSIVDINIGSIEHPSEKEHFIQWIEILDGEISLGKVYLTPFVRPKTSFVLKEKINSMKVRIFCNLHGTWEYS